jgi:uncharacterized protein (TIGR03067 family)
MTIQRVIVLVAVGARALLAAVLATAGFACGVGAQPTASLDGAWTAVAAERDGKPAEELKGHRLMFARDTFVIERGGKVLYKGTFKVEAAKRPAQIDFHNTDGEAKGKTWLGIYLLDGDMLRIADNAPDPSRPRPAQLNTRPGSGHVMLTFKRMP